MIEQMQSERLNKLKFMKNISIITQSTPDGLKLSINDRETVKGPLTVIVYDGQRAIVKTLWLWLSEVLDLKNVLIQIGWLKLLGCQSCMWSASKLLVEGPAKALGSGPDSSFEGWLWPLTKWFKNIGHVLFLLKRCPRVV